MPLPPKPFLRLDEVCRRWGVTIDDIADYAFANSLILSARVIDARMEVGFYEGDVGMWQRVPEKTRRLTGTPDLYVQDAWAILKTGRAMVSSFRPDRADHFMDAADDDGIPLEVEDIVIRLDEVERFESEGRGTASVTVLPPSAAPRGKPPRYDWDAFWVEVCRRVHDEGLPSTQAVLVRHMLDWFAANGGAVPDDSTIKKKVAPLWRALDISADQRSA